MPLIYLKYPCRCTKCNVPLPTKSFHSKITYNRKSALVSEPTVVDLYLCLKCHSDLTDRMFHSLMVVDQIDIAQHYGKH